MPDSGSKAARVLLEPMAGTHAPHAEPKASNFARRDYDTIFLLNDGGGQRQSVIDDLSDTVGVPIRTAAFRLSSHIEVRQGRFTGQSALTQALAAMVLASVKVLVPRGTTLRKENGTDEGLLPRAAAIRTQFHY